MFNGRYIELQELIYRLKRHPLLANVEIGDIAYDAIDVIKLVGAPVMYESMWELLDVKEYRAEIPCELINVLSIGRITDQEYVTPLNKSTSTRGGNWKCATASGLKSVQLDTYDIKRGYIYFDFEEGQAEINYKAIACDESGFPKIPDDTSLIKAIEAAVKVNHFGIKVDLGEIAQHVLQRAEQDYTWYIGQAQGSLLMPDIDEMESIKNALIRIIPNTRQHDTGFKFQSQDPLSVGNVTNSIRDGAVSGASDATPIDLLIQFPFAAGVVELSPLTVIEEQVGLYDTLQVDPLSIGGVINLNGVDTAVPFSLAIGDTVIAKRTVGTAEGWLTISFNG